MIIPSCVLFYSLINGINPIITKSIIQIESNGNPYSFGTKDDVGLMQIRSKFVPENEIQLLNPCTNIKRGVQLLKKYKEKCVHRLDNTWVICYNLGISGARKIKYPKKFSYYKKFTSVFKGI